MNLAGNPSIHELPSDIEGDSQRGPRAVRKWRGLRTDLLNFIPFINTAGVQYSLQSDEPPWATLTVRFSDAQDGSDPNDPANLNTIWSLDGNDLEKDLFSYPGIAGANPTAVDLAKEIQSINNGLEAVQTNGDNPANYFPPFPNPFSTATALEIFALKLAGVESYSVSQYVLRRTTTVPGSYSGQFASVNVGKKYTTEQLITAEVIPLTILFEMPPGEWLKRTPSFRQLATGQWEISSEWWHADTWPAPPYPPADL